jgi:drug/metabolite transporter (DMT)-like permease
MENIMTWVIFALFAAFLNASKNLLSKKVSIGSDPYTVALFSNLSMLPILWGVAVFVGDFAIEPQFWTIIALMLPVEILVTVLFFRAIQDSELSSSFPFVSFLPFFVAIGSFFILKESIGPNLVIGLFFLTGGAFLLQRVLASDKKIVWKGAGYMFLVSLLWGYIIPMGKLAVSYSTEHLFPAIYFTLSTLLFVPLYAVKHTKTRRGSLVDIRPYAMIGLCYGLFVAFNWMAYSQGPTSGVAALALVSILFTVIMGGTYFKEQKLLAKLGATCLMLIGAIVIILGK